MYTKVVAWPLLAAQTSSKLSGHHSSSASKARSAKKHEDDLFDSDDDFVQPKEASRKLTRLSKGGDDRTSGAKSKPSSEPSREKGTTTNSTKSSRRTASSSTSSSSSHKTHKPSPSKLRRRADRYEDELDEVPSVDPPPGYQASSIFSRSSSSSKITPTTTTKETTISNSITIDDEDTDAGKFIPKRRRFNINAPSPSHTPSPSPSSISSTSLSKPAHGHDDGHDDDADNILGFNAMEDIYKKARPVPSPSLPSRSPPSSPGSSTDDERPSHNTTTRHDEDIHDDDDDDDDEDYGPRSRKPRTTTASKPPQKPSPHDTKAATQTKTVHTTDKNKKVQSPAKNSRSTSKNASSSATSSSSSRGGSRGTTKPAHVQGIDLSDEETQADRDNHVDEIIADSPMKKPAPRKTSTKGGSNSSSSASGGGSRARTISSMFQVSSSPPDFSDPIVTDRPPKKGKGDDRADTNTKRGGTNGKHKSKHTGPGADGGLWVDFFVPHREDELCVHKKRVGEVKQWIEASIRGFETRSPAPKLLVLTGPCGSGKTAVVRALASTLQYQVVEWINPTAEARRDVANHATEAYYDLNKLDKFALWLRVTSMSQDLFATQERKVILLEDLPILDKKEERDQFQSMLRTFLKSTRFPMVLVLSDSFMGNSSLGMLLSNDLRNVPFISQIKFNPVAPGLMTKALTAIASSSGHYVSTQVVREIEEQSGGDIRAAIHALQFYCIRTLPQQTKPKSSKISSTRSKSGTDVTNAIDLDDFEDSSPPTSTSLSSSSLPSSGSMFRAPRPQSHTFTKQSTLSGSRDLSISVFHALGKVLHNKRNPDTSAPNTPLPWYHRAPSQYIPERILEQVHFDPARFSAFIHENVLDFVQDFDEIVPCTYYLSESDLYSGTMELNTSCMSQSLGNFSEVALNNSTNFSTNHHKYVALSPYITSLAIRGTMFANTQPLSGQRRSLYSPVMLDILKHYTTNSTNLSRILQPSPSQTSSSLWVGDDDNPPHCFHPCMVGSLVSPTSFATELVPFAHLIRSTALRQGQHSPTFKEYASLLDPQSTKVLAQICTFTQSIAGMHHRDFKNKVRETFESTTLDEVNGDIPWVEGEGDHNHEKGERTEEDEIED
eukprot:TRINITY_DN7983_c0_g1_i3.p1 TRINITY_DN7983_c0_g1~~TRINITY_DN7983_c0_g1_i3.p1  ORF type:complete len:1159 (+),score=309.14 TRINITY_DN7983_c0_g1_i3:127-3477(+)